MTGLSVVMRLFAARIRHQPQRGLVTILGVAVAVGMLAGSLGAASVAGDRELRRALDALPAGYRSLTVSYSSGLLDPAERARRARVALRALASILPVPARSQVLLRELSNGRGGFFRLAGIDGLAGAARLVSGRMASACTPSRCEVDIAAGPALPLDPSLGLVVVGRVTLRDPALLSGTFAPSASDLVLTANGVAAADRVASLSAILRSYGWVAPLPAAAVSVSTARALVARISAAGDAASAGGMTLTAPDDVITGTLGVASTASHRLDIVAADASALVAAFALLAAFGARRNHRNALLLLQARGARRAHTLVFSLAEAAWPVAIGTVIGIGAAAMVLGVVGGERGQAIAQPLPLIIVALAAVLAVTSVLRLPERPLRRGVWLSDIAGGVMAAVALAAAARGQATSSNLQAQSDPLLGLLPVATIVVAAAVCVRVLPWMLAACGRVVRAPLMRLAVSDAIRRPLWPLATAGFLAACGAMTMFAASYRATLAAGAADQATFQVPLDFRLTVGGALILPTDAAPPGGFAALAAGTVATPVLRRSAAVHTSSLAGDAVTLLGVSPDALPRVGRWRGDYGPSPARLADLLRFPTTLAGAAIPPGSSTLRLRVRGDTQLVDIALITAASDGRLRELEPTAAGTDGLRYAITPGFAAARIVGFRLAESAYAADRVLHAIGEGTGFQPALVTRVRLGPLVSAGGVIPLAWQRLVTANASSVVASASGIALRGTLQGSAMVVRYPQATDTTPLPVLTDRQTAAAARSGLLVIDDGAQTPLAARVVAVGAWFPTAGSRFVVADESALRTALDTQQAGTGTPDEEWLSAAGAAGQRRLRSILGRPPLNSLVVQDRTAIETSLADDPLARIAITLLWLAAVGGLLLGACGLVLVVIADRADNAAAYYALEADGATPGALRRVLFTRAAALALGAAPVGIAAGLALSAIVTSLVAVTASATSPIPPLQSVAGVASGLGVLSAALAVAALAAGVAAATMFREPLPTAEVLRDA